MNLNATHPGPCAGEKCRLCWLARNDPRYARLWAQMEYEATHSKAANRPAPPPAYSPPTKPSMPQCKHLLPTTDETVECASCKGSVKLKVFGCSVHGKCLPTRPVDGLAYCPTCPDNTTRVTDVSRPSERVVKSYAEARLMKWAYGVTTVPSRFNDLLPRTLKSLATAGFDQPRLFVDGLPESAPSGTDYDITVRVPPVRTHGNWWLALHELYLRDPYADRYAVFQDDLVAVRNLRGYLEQAPYPSKSYLNLYTTVQNAALCPANRTGFYPSNQMGRGALALVFNNEACIELLSAKHMVVRVRDTVRGHKSVDGGVVTAMKEAGFTEYVHNPSLVQHTGLTSSMGNTPSQPSPTFPGEVFDALELIPKEATV